MENDSNNEVRAIRRTPANSVSLPLKHGFDLFWIIAICRQSLDLQGYRIAHPWLLQNINSTHKCKHTNTKKQNRILRLYSEGETREHKAQGGECSAEGRVGGTESSSRSSSKSKPCKVRRGSRLEYYQGRETDHIKKTLSAEKVDRFYNLFQEWGKGPWGRPPIHAEVIEESSTDCTRRPQSSKVGCETAHLGKNYIFQKETFCRNVLF